MIEILLAKGFQLSLSRLGNWTFAYYFITESLNPEKVDVNKNSLVLHDFVYFAMLNQLGKRTPGVKEQGQIRWFCHGVSQKPLSSPSHTSTFAHTIIRSIPSAKSYTYTLTKHAYISHQKDYFSNLSFDDSEPFHFCCSLKTLEGL